MFPSRHARVFSDFWSEPLRSHLLIAAGTMLIETRCFLQMGLDRLTSRAETNCSGLNALFMSGMFVSRSYNAFAMLVSSSDGRCLDGLVDAILLRAAMVANVMLVYLT